jgi:hypothetical protein
MLLEATIATASGKLGGVVASTRHGSIRIAAHANRRRTPTVRQANTAQALATITAKWRTLAAGDRLAWQNAPASVPSPSGSRGAVVSGGYHRFVAAQRNLHTVGVFSILRSPVQPARFPIVTNFSAQAEYSADQPPYNLIGFTIDVEGNMDSPTIGVLSATAVGTRTRTNFPRSAFKDLLQFMPSTTPILTIFDAYSAVFGTPPTWGALGFGLRFIDPASGVSSPFVKTVCVYEATLPSQFPPYTVIIQTEGHTAAAIPAQTIQVEGSDVAN